MTPRPFLRLSSPWDVKDSIGSVEVGRNMCLRLYLTSVYVKVTDYLCMWACTDVNAEDGKCQCEMTGNLVIILEDNLLVHSFAL